MMKVDVVIKKSVWLFVLNFVDARAEECFVPTICNGQPSWTRLSQNCETTWKNATVGFPKEVTELTDKLESLEELIADMTKKITFFRTNQATSTQSLDYPTFIPASTVADIKNHQSTQTTLSVNLESWYKASNNYFYKLFNDKVNYETAKSNCLVYGANLACAGIRNPVVFSKLRSFVKTHGGPKTWIGLKESQTDDDKYIWSDGVGAEERNISWGAAEPTDTRKGEDCAAMWPSFGYKLNDELCTATFQYLCEIRL